MPTLHLAAATTGTATLSSGHVLGSLGTGGIALVLTALLILGVRNKSKHKMSHEHAGIIGFIAGTLYLAAGQLWSAAGSLTDSLASTVTGPDGPLGNVGLGAVALVLFLWWWLGHPRPGKAALLGIASGSLFAAAGGIWGIASAMILTIAGHFGA
jgi:hypothetical protein